MFSFVTLPNTAKYFTELCRFNNFAVDLNREKSHVGREAEDGRFPKVTVFEAVTCITRK